MVLVVFDTFRVSDGPDLVDNESGIAGVERFGKTARVVVNDSFDITKGLPELVTNLMPGQTVESKLPPKESEQEAATPPG